MAHMLSALGTRKGIDWSPLRRAKYAGIYAAVWADAAKDVGAAVHKHGMLAVLRANSALGFIELAAWLATATVEDVFGNWCIRRPEGREISYLKNCGVPVLYVRRSGGGSWEIMYYPNWEAAASMEPRIWVDPCSFTIGERANREKSSAPRSRS